MTMKKTFLSIAVCLLSAFSVFTSCSVEIEANGNGALDGFWHLEQVDTLATGGKADLSSRRLFWGVQAKLVSVRDFDKNDNGYYLRFAQTSDSLTLSSPYANNWHENEQNTGGDVPVTDATVLAPFGINNLTEGFCKETLKGGTMVLRSKRLRLHFKKF